MKTLQASATLLIFCALLVLAGCHRNKPVVLLPQQPPASTASETPSQQPPPNTQEPRPAQQQPAAGQEQANADKPPAKPAKPQPRHPRRATTANTNKPAPASSNSTAVNSPGVNSNDKHSPEKPTADKPQEVARNVPPRIVIQDGGSTNSGAVQITPGPSQDDPNQTTGQLLDSTDNNLRSIKRQLSADEQTRVTEIRDYQAQARQAIKDGDMVRAHKLALKAHVLSDELVKQR